MITEEFTKAFKLDAVIKKVERMIEIIPDGEDDSLKAALKSKLQSLNYSHPDNCKPHLLVISENLEQHLGYGELTGWKLDIYNEWMRDTREKT